jgi:hypothetical protein
MSSMPAELVRSHNGAHHRPHAGGSARGRVGLELANLLIVRGRASYMSRFAAWVFWAPGRHSGNHFAELGIVINVTSSGCDPIVPGFLGLLSRSFVFGTGHAPCSGSRNIRIANTLVWKKVHICKNRLRQTSSNVFGSWLRRASRKSAGNDEHDESLCHELWPIAWKDEHYPSHCRNNTPGFGRRVVRSTGALSDVHC